LIEVSGFWDLLLLQPCADPGDKVPIDVDLLQKLEILETLLVDLLADFEPQLQRQLLNETI